MHREKKYMMFSKLTHISKLSTEASMPQIGTYVCFLFSKMSFFSVLSVGIYTDGNSWPTKDFTVKTKPNAKMKTTTDSGN